MNRTSPSQKMRDLAGRLLAYEAEAADAPGANMPAALRVSEKLRLSLITLAGDAGFRSLLARALTLAKREAQGLTAVYVKPDGSLDGLSELHDDECADAGSVLTAQLIGLLATLVGEHLTLWLLHDVWPDLALDDTNAAETKST